MVISIRFVLVMTVVNFVNYTSSETQTFGECFLRRSLSGCREHMGKMTRKQCCLQRGFFVRRPDLGQLFLNMHTAQIFPNCENPCDTDYCEGKDCGDGHSCIQRDSDSICSSECTCTSEQRNSAPVCVQRGPKYRTMCDYHLNSCWTNTKRTIVPCLRSGCARKQCGEGKKCFLNLRGLSECSHPTPNSNCAIPEPLCGVDNVTYSNHCHLRNAGIQRKRAIHIAYKGVCKNTAKCSNIECPDRDMSCVRHHTHSMPVCVKCPRSMLDCNKRRYQSDELYCLSINRQSKNTCFKDYLSCQDNVFIEIVHSGLCLQTAQWSRPNL